MVEAVTGGEVSGDGSSISAASLCLKLHRVLGSGVKSGQVVLCYRGVHNHFLQGGRRQETGDGWRLNEFTFFKKHLLLMLQLYFDETTTTTLV